jgi:ankyrin repeat protein
MDNVARFHYAMGENAEKLKLLFAAIRAGDLTALRELLNSGVDVNAVQGTYTPLGCAVEKGSAQIVNTLLLAGADPNRGGIVTPLHHALQYKRIRIAEALLKAGADVNLQGDYGTTPLMMAVLSGSAKSTQLALESGADPSIRNDGQETAYEIALKNRKIRIAAILEGVSPPTTQPTAEESLRLKMLFDAAGKGCLQDMQQVIDNGVDVNGIAPKMLDTALAEAAWEGHLDCVAILLNAGASPNVYGYWPPLAKAASGGHIAIMNLLLEAGADVDAFSADDETALMRAAQKSHMESAMLLIEAGADVNAAGHIGKTPLSQAYDYEWRYRKRNPVVDLLLENGASNLGAYSKAYSNWKRP